MTRQRVVVAGLGDSGLLTAIKLTRHLDVVGISAKPELVSGQELGMRLTRPDYWAKDYRVAFDRYRRLDGARIVHGTLAGLDLAARTVTVEGADGSTRQEPYDVLVISTGVTNGFWRQPTLQSADEVSADLRAAHERLASARSVIVVGGGAAAVGSAANLASTWPDKQIDLYFPGERALPRHHGRVWGRVRHRLTDLGVELHPGHRAELPDGFAGDEITREPVRWSTGQAPVSADAVLWAVGKVRPNTAWLPPELLDDDGFVRVTPELRVPATLASTRSATSRRPTRCARRPGTGPTDCWPATSVPRSRVDRSVASTRRGVDGARCSESSTTAWRSSPRRATRSGSLPGRWTVSCEA